MLNPTPEEIIARKRRLGIVTTPAPVNIPLSPAEIIVKEERERKEEAFRQAEIIVKEERERKEEAFRQAAIDAKIARCRDILTGCRLPKRIQMLILPVLDERDMPWRLLNIGQDARRAAVRREIWALLYLEGETQSQIGRWFGRDNSTVLHGLRRAGVKP